MKVRLPAALFDIVIKEGERGRRLGQPRFEISYLEAN
jgi:hypothetical protein